MCDEPTDSILSADRILSADSILSGALIIIHQRHHLCLQNKQNQMMQQVLHTIRYVNTSMHKFMKRRRKKQKMCINVCLYTWKIRTYADNYLRTSGHSFLSWMLDKCSHVHIKTLLAHSAYTWLIHVCAENIQVCACTHESKYAVHNKWRHICALTPASSMGRLVCRGLRGGSAHIMAHCEPNKQ